MSLSDLASIGSFISGLAVLISLVFLYFQLRQVGLQVEQAERNQQAAIRQGRVARMVEINMASIEPSMADAFLKATSGAEDISPVQAFQFMSFYRSIFSNVEDGFYQHSEGLLNETAFSNLVVAVKSGFSTPGQRAAWTLASQSYGREFVEFMNERMAETRAIAPPDFLARWRAAIAVQMSEAGA
jgi:hypothetical protein